MLVDWAGGLPSDVLAYIVERMETFDQARFACVCTRWLVAAKQAKLRQPPPLPWVMLPTFSDGADGDGACTFSGFPAAGVDPRAKTCRISLPQYIWRRCVGTSPDGWLVVLGKDRELCMVNPLTRGQLALPPIATIPEVANELRCSTSEKEYSNFIYHYFKKAVMFELPTHGLMVAALVDSRVHWVVFTVVGGAAWFAVDMPADFDSQDFVEDIAFHGGRLYGITDLEMVLACDITAHCSPPVTEVYQLHNRPPATLHQHLVHFASPSMSRLLVIYRCPRTEEPEEAPLPMHVMRLEQVRPRDLRCVADVADLGGHAIFLDDWCCSMAVPVNGDFPEVKANHIYNTRVHGHVCRVEAVDLRSVMVEDHHLGEAEGYYQPTTIWFWPVVKL